MVKSKIANLKSKILLVLGNWFTRQIKLIIIFAGAIMFPTILLGYFAIRTAETERLLVWEKLKESYTSLANVVSDRLDNMLSSAESDFRNFVLALTVYDKANLQLLSVQLKSKHKLIGQIFFLNSTGKIIFPDAADVQQQSVELHRFMKNYERLISDEVTKIVNRAAGNSGLVLHIFKSTDSSPYLVSYILMNKSAEGSSDVPVLAGFEVDLGYMASQGFKEVLNDLTIRDDVILAILNDDDKIVNPLTEMLSGKSVTTVMSASMPFWKVGVYLKEPQSLEKLSNRKASLRIYVIVGLVLTIAFGIYIALRESRREAELARLRSDFVANVSHELRTPLSSIQIFSETLKQNRIDSRDRRERYLDTIASESNRLARLVDNVLDFSRLERHTKEFNFWPTNIGEVVVSAVEAYRFYAEQRGITVHLNKQENLPEIEADREAISQMVTNLVDNAVKYSEDGSEVIVNVFRRRGKVVIQVADRGVGIDEEDIKKIFDKFYRGKNVANLGTGGTGLGLTLAKAVAVAHGGDILVKSKIGVGSKFSVILPLS